MADIDNRKDKEEKTQNGMGRRIFSFLKGMPFSFILLGLMILGCIAGSIVPQNQPLHVYYDTYGAAKGNILLSLSLNHVFTSWWFILITGLLCFNLILCSISRTDRMMKFSPIKLFPLPLQNQLKTTLQTSKV
ncbi:MAG: cytochrome c biogenesis protein ResB, partial [Firmicutes bacterium]|nr:cytochrome c biogenesis protein ResB [Bacillota bacterium]